MLVLLADFGFLISLLMFIAIIPQSIVFIKYKKKFLKFSIKYTRFKKVKLLLKFITFKREYKGDTVIRAI